MRRAAFALSLATFAILSAASPPPPEPNQATDLEMIQGVWSVVGLETGGQSAPEKNFRGNTITFGRDKGTERATLREGQLPPVEFSVVIDAAKSPNTIDLTAKGNTLKGIYRLDGDNLTVAVGFSGARPAEFATKAGADVEVFTLKRNAWERYADKTFEFAVDLPGKPDERRSGDITYFETRGEYERLTYYVAVMTLPGQPDPKQSEAAFDAVQKALVVEIDATAKWKVEAEGKFKQPAGIMAARELTLSLDRPGSKDKSAVRLRLYVAGARVFALAATGSEDAVRSPQVNRFWGSFRISGEKKKDPPAKQNSMGRSPT